jgi:hypothetical protein
VGGGVRKGAVKAGIIIMQIAMRCKIDTPPLDWPLIQHAFSLVD